MLDVFHNPCGLARCLAPVLGLWEGARRAWRSRYQVEACCQLSTDLRQHASNLLALTRDTEAGFLTVGGALQELAQGAAHIFTRSESLLSGVSGQDSESPVANARRLLVAAGRVSADCDEALDKASAAWLVMSERFQRLGELAAGFSRHVSSLRALGGYLRIVSAPDPEAAVEFAEVASQALQVSQCMRTNMTELQDDAQRAAGTCDAASARVVQDLHELRRQRQGAQSMAEAALDKLDALLRAREHAAAETSRHLGAVHAQVNELITALQFHDIARQQLEHVAAALAQVADDVGPTFPVPHAPAGRATLVLSTVHVQREQLRSVAGQVARVANQMRASLRKLSDTLAAQGGMIRRWSAPTAQQATAIAELGAALEATINSVRQAARAGTSAATTLATLTEFTTLITKQADVTRQAATDLRRLALNAQIKSIRAGPAGWTTNVISREMGVLSRRAGADAQEMLTEMGRVGGDVDTLRDLLTHRLKNADTEGSQLSARAVSLVDAIHALRDAADDNTQQLLKGLNQLREDVNRASAAVQFDEMMLPLLKDVENYLTQVLGRLVPPDGQSVARVAVACAAPTGSERYTMLIERRVHEAALANVDWAAPAPVATPAAVTTDASASASNGGEFGDNVELF